MKDINEVAKNLALYLLCIYKRDLLNEFIKITTIK